MIACGARLRVHGIFQRNFSGELAELSRQFPDIEMQALSMDFSSTLALPGSVRCGNRLFFYPGSSIGNFTPESAIDLLSRLAPCGAIQRLGIAGCADEMSYGHHTSAIRKFNDYPQYPWTIMEKSPTRAGLFPADSGSYPPSPFLGVCLLISCRRSCLCHRPYLRPFWLRFWLRF